MPMFSFGIFAKACALLLETVGKNSAYMLAPVLAELS